MVKKKQRVFFNRQTKALTKAKVLIAVFAGVSLSVSHGLCDNAASAVAGDSPWSLSSQLSFSTPAYQEEGIEPQNDLELLFLPSYKINQDYTVSLRTEYGEDLKNRSKSEINLARLSLGYRAVELQPFWKLAPSVRYAIPVKQADREEGNYNGSLSIASVLSLDSERALQPDWSLSLGAVLTKNFFVYDTDVSGASTISQSAAMSIDVSKRFGLWSVNLVGGYSYASTFSGDYKQIFEITEEVSYNLSTQWSALLGHTNSASPFLADGISSNLQIVDETSSRLYVGAAISL